MDCSREKNDIIDITCLLEDQQRESDNVHLDSRNNPQSTRNHIFVPGALLDNVLLTPDSLSRDFRKRQEQIQADAKLRDWFGQIEISGFDGTDLSTGEYLALFGALELNTRRGFKNIFSVSKEELYDSGGVKKDAGGVYQTSDINTLLKGYRSLSVYNRPIWIKRYRKESGLTDVIATWEPYLGIMPLYKGITIAQCNEIEHRGLDISALKKADSFQIELNKVFLDDWGNYYSRLPANPARVVREYMHEIGKQIKPYHFRFLAVLGQNRQRSNKIRLATLIERLGLERMRGNRGLRYTQAFIENELFELAIYAGWIEGEPAIRVAVNGDVLYSFMLTRGLKHTQVEQKTVP